MAENQFQGHQKKEKKKCKKPVPTGPWACVREREGFFFQQHFGFPFAEGNQPAAPESSLLVKARS